MIVQLINIMCFLMAIAKISAGNPVNGADPYIAASMVIIAINFKKP